MGRQQFNDGMEVIFQDYNSLQARLQQEFYDRVIFEIIQRTENAFFGTSHAVNFASANTVIVQQGSGFQTDSTVAANEPTRRLLFLKENSTLTIQAPDTVNDRIDKVVAKAELVDTETEERRFKAASTNEITDEELTVAIDWQSKLMIVAGEPGANPVAPATPAGYVELACLTVGAVSGLANADSVEDKRNIVPLGGLSTVSSAGFERLTVSAELTLQQALSEVDALLARPCPISETFKPLTEIPDAPTNEGERLVYNLEGQLFVRESDPEGGAVAPLGSGAGGAGGGAQWAGSALEKEEFGQKVFAFAQGEAQELCVFLKIPQGYLSGRQVLANLGFYTPSSMDNFQMTLTTSLIRRGQDAINSDANQAVSVSEDIENDNAYEFREVMFQVTDDQGRVNGFNASPGDLLKIQLTRSTPTNTEDAEAIRFVPSTTEVIFG